MTLETMTPNPGWDREANADVVETFAPLADEITIKVWGGDWCGDCQDVLPDFGAALAAADVPTDRIVHYEVEKLEDGSKVGPKVDAYGIEYIPTIVIERDGKELVRFVEEEPVSAERYLADRLRKVEASP